MKVRAHAVQRILERSKLPPRHVNDIVSHAAFVDLGLGRACRLALFYSPPDKGTKIAVISPDGASLLSLWNNNFVLPRGVTRVTPELEEEARAILHKFLQARFSQNGGLEQLAVTIDIRIEERVVSVRDGGDIRTEDARTQSSLLAAVAPVLAPIAIGVHEDVDDDPNRVRYGIHLINSRTFLRAKRFVTVRHSTVMRHVSKAA